MGQYRNSRNIEASLVDFLTAQLATDGWSGIRVVKDFAQAYDGPLPCIVIGVNNIDPIKLEIGSKTNIEYYEISIRIIATSDGSRLDLSDWLLDLLENDINYYSYTITNGAVSAKVLTGRIVVTEIKKHAKELTNTENLELADKYRNITTFNAIIAQ